MTPPAPTEVSVNTNMWSTPSRIVLFASFIVLLASCSDSSCRRNQPLVDHSADNGWFLGYRLGDSYPMAEWTERVSSRPYASPESGTIDVVADDPIRPTGIQRVYLRLSPKSFRILEIRGITSYAVERRESAHRAGAAFRDLLFAKYRGRCKAPDDPSGDLYLLELACGDGASELLVISQIDYPAGYPSADPHDVQLPWVVGEAPRPNARYDIMLFLGISAKGSRKALWDQAKGEAMQLVIEAAQAKGQVRGT